MELETIDAIIAKNDLFASLHAAVGKLDWKNLYFEDTFEHCYTAALPNNQGRIYVHERGTVRVYGIGRVNVEDVSKGLYDAITGFLREPETLNGIADVVAVLNEL